MKKILAVILTCVGVQGFADVPVTSTSTTDMAETFKGSAVRLDSMKNLHSLIEAVSKAKDVQNQIAALKNLNDFTKDPVNATGQVNSVVGDMLNSFNMKSGTSFGNLQELISSLSGSTTATGMSLKLQQSSATQLQNISVILQQIEAENQVMLRYRQADDALKAHQAQLAKDYQEKEIKAMRAKTQNIEDAFQKE